MKHFAELARFGLTALCMLGLKFGLTHALAFTIPPLLAYLATQGILTVVSYFGHARFTFHERFTSKGFFRYARVIILFQALDYAVFAVLFGTLDWNTTYSIAAATVVIFLIRFLAIRRSFRNDPIARPTYSHVQTDSQRNTSQTG